MTLMQNFTLGFLRFALLVIAAATFAFSSGCSTNPATGKSQLILVDDSQLDAMGAQAMPMLVEEYGGPVPETELRQYVNWIGQQLAKHVEPEYGEISWQFITLNSDVINAFALPGGRIFISRGLLQHLTNEAQIAAVLGHEIGHVTARHIDERMSQATALDVGLQIGGQVTESQLAVAAAQLFGQGYLLKFGRDQELESDRLGLRYMMEAGYDPHAMVDVVNVLIQAAQGGSPPEFLSTHPDPERRLEQVQQLLATAPYSTTRNNPNFGTFEQRFKKSAAPYLGGGNRAAR